MKIILKGLHDAIVNFDNVFMIDVHKPDNEENPWKIIAYSGREPERFDHSDCILFQGTEEAVQAWIKWFSYWVSKFGLSDEDVCFILTPNDFNENYDEYLETAENSLGEAQKKQFMKKLRKSNL